MDITGFPITSSLTMWVEAQESKSLWARARLLEWRCVISTKIQNEDDIKKKQIEDDIHIDCRTVLAHKSELHYQLLSPT